MRMLVIEDNHRLNSSLAIACKRHQSEGDT